MSNFTDIRMGIEFTDNLGNLHINKTYNNPEVFHVTGDNVVYNETDVKELHWLVNGKHPRKSTKWLMEGFRCVQHNELLWECKDEEVKEKEIPNYSIPWSKTSTWPSGKLPVEGEVVEIPPGVWIEYDIEESPILEKLTINGRLSFKDDPENPVNRTLHSYIIYVRQGELLIGSENQPYSGNATIKLYGDPEADTIAPSFNTEFGNKGLFIVGLAEFHGQRRNQNTRLKETVY